MGDRTGNAKGDRGGKRVWLIAGPPATAGPTGAAQLSAPCSRLAGGPLSNGVDHNDRLDVTAFVKRGRTAPVDHPLRSGVRAMNIDIDDIDDINLIDDEAVLTPRSSGGGHFTAEAATAIGVAGLGLQGGSEGGHGV